MATNPKDTRDSRHASFDWASGRPLAFVVLWCSGDDPGLDGVLRLQALRAGDQPGEWERFDCWCDPCSELEDETSAARDRHSIMSRLGEDFGVLPESLDGGAENAWRDLAAFLAGHTVVSADRATFEAWAAHLGGGFDAVPPTASLAEVACLLFPGRLAGRGPALVLDLITEAERSSDLALHPEDLRNALAELVARFLRLDNDRVGVITTTLVAAWAGLVASDFEAAASLERVLQLVDAPQHWAPQARSAELPSARLQHALHDTEELPFILDDLEPRWTDEALAWLELEPLPPDRDGPLPFHDEDEATCDAVFAEHLPEMFGAQTSEERANFYRKSQHDVAKEVALTIGASGKPETQLLLVHAPTGTGKTLAYLLPALLWSRRHEVRVGIATYTRALQEQAMDREVPRALQALRRAGVQAGFRVTMLKGRENYLCWRALKLHIPDAEARAEDWLAFAQLVSYALTDSEGDLDRLPRRPPLPTLHARAYRGALNDSIRHVRAQTSCCRAKDDRKTCAAEVVRWRAERSHLVITNHSFALARQEFFRHVIFDECEHLHDQAHAAWSHGVDLSGVRTWLKRLESNEGGRRRGLFRRLDKRLVVGTKSSDTLTLCRTAREALDVACEELAGCLEAFLRWRAHARRERTERDDHAMLREYIESESGGPLIAARARFHRTASELDGMLAEMAERLDDVAGRKYARLRRSLDLARVDLTQFLEGVAAWLPLQEGRPVFSPRTFHDVEDGTRGQVELAARVLLPNEYLGRFYYPSLATASFLSATTWLRGSFEASKSYTGLDRAVDPLADEERLPCTLRSFCAPEVFDYSRVLVAVPRDAPAVSAGKDAYLAYVRDFLADLGERTGGRILALFTNSDDVRRVGARLEGHFRARRVPFYYQNMEGSSKEELSELFLRRRNSILLGVDTFWYGADFPGETLEYLVIVRLPYGVPDRYHHAQCAALGAAEQRRQIYMPRALAKFRQGFGRLMRRVSDKGCVFMLDHRVLDPRHRAFLGELPLNGIGDEQAGLARFVRGDTERCLEQAMIHMGLAQQAAPLEVDRSEVKAVEHFEPKHESEPTRAPSDVSLDDLPF